MAEALGVTASILGMAPILQGMGKSLRQSSWDGDPPRLKQHVLKLEIEIMRANLIQESIKSLDVSSSAIQEILRLFESVVRQLMRLAEETTNYIRKASPPGKTKWRTIKLSFLESNLSKQEKELGDVREHLNVVEHGIRLMRDTSVLGPSLRREESMPSWVPDWSGISFPNASLSKSSVYHTESAHGLQILSEPSNAHEIDASASSEGLRSFDIVFIHGLNADSASTWRAVDKYWPKDMLSADFPQARIMTFDYDSKPSTSSPLLANNLSTEKSLVDMVVSAQRGRGLAQQLLFCAHSFGGILLQKAVAYCCRTRGSERSSRDFLATLKGFIFLGTPHLNSRSMSLQYFIEKLTPLTSRSLLNSLTPSIESTVKDLDVFSDFVRDEKVPVFSFYESQPTTTPNGPIRICIPDRDVNRDDPYFLSGNHATMCKFQTATDTGYLKIKEAIEKIIRRSMEPDTSFQRLSRGGIDRVDRLKPLKPDQQRFAPSQSLIQEAQQDYSEQLRVFLFRLRIRIPAKRPWSERLSGSCDWIMETDAFKDWRSDKGSIFLILLGASGSGRSKISQHLVECFKKAISEGQTGNLQRTRITLSYFCDWTLPARDQAFTWLYELLLQLLESNASLFREIYRKTDSPPIMYSDLEALVLRLLQTSSLREIDIVIDGLDECNLESLRLIQKTMDQLPTLMADRKLRILVTTNNLTGIPQSVHQQSKEIHLNLFKKERNKYIDAFIKERLMGSINKHRYSGRLLVEISEGLFQKASLDIHANEVGSSKEGDQDEESAGNFIWISSAIAIIEGERSAGGMKQALQKLPNKLSPLYDKRLQRIPTNDCEFVARTLHFIHCSFRSLETKALAFALAINEGHRTMREVFEEQILDLQEVLTTFTGNLVVVNNDCVSFAHQTFSKYLKETASEDFKSLPPLQNDKTHHELATACLRCLMLEDVMEDDTPPLSATKINEETLELWTPSFLHYAETYWFEHFKQASNSPELMKLMISFFSSHKLELWLANRRNAQPELLLPKSISAHHILAALDLLNSQDVLDQLPWPNPDGQDESAGPNQRDSIGMIALHYAIANNALQSIRFLKEQESDVSAIDTQGRSCLHFAVYSGNLELIEQFMSQPSVHPSLLNLAIERRNWEVVELLLEKVTAVPEFSIVPEPSTERWTEWRGQNGQGIIHQAVLSRRDSIVERLLEKHANLDLTDNEGRTALHWAAKIAERSIVEALIENSQPNSSLDTTDNAGDTALHLATAAGDIEIVRLLAEHGADLEIVNKAGQLPLHYAAMYGYESIVDFLLAMGSPVNTTSNYASPLHMASAWGWYIVAKRLIRAGADIESKDDKGRSPLYLAAYNGSKVMAELLISFGADADACDLEGRTPLHVAALGGWTPVVTLLLKAGANVHAKEKKKLQTSLHFAANSKNPSSELVERLIDAGAKITQEDAQNNSAYACAKANGNTLIAELLDKFGKEPSSVVKKSSEHALRDSMQSTASASRLELLWEAESREELQNSEILAGLEGEGERLG